MADTCVEFLQILGDVFYFQRTDEDMYHDGLCKSSHCDFKYIQGNDRYLIIDELNEFQCKGLRTADKGPDYKFHIQFYINSDKTPQKGRAVMLFNSRDGKKLAVCCKDDKQLYPKEMEIPTNYQDDEDQSALFIMTDTIQTDKFMFESKVHRKNFLAFEEDGSLYKLVLRQKDDEDTPDSSTEVKLTD